MALHNYWWLLIWPLLYGIITYFLRVQRNEVVLGKQELRWRPFFAFAMVIPLIIWAAWRSHFGDTELYRRTFLSLPTGFSSIFPYLRGEPKDRGFRFLELLFKTVISTSDIFFFLIIALVQLLCVVSIYRKYSCNYWLSIFFFIASTDYLSWMFNGMRQFLAVALVFACIPLLLKKKYIWMALIVLLISQIHLTALIFLPFIFIVNGRAWNYRTVLFLLVMIVAIIFVDRVTGFITNAMEDTAYEGDISLFLNDDGTHILRVLFYSVPAIMSFFFRERIHKADNPVINICANMSIVAAAIYVFSFFTSGLLIGRLPIYFSLANYILIPWMIKEFFTRKSALIVEGAFILVYLFFFYYQCGPTWGIL